MVLATCVLASPGKLKGVGGPLWNEEYAFGHLESLQEAESATRLAPPPSTLTLLSRLRDCQSQPRKCPSMFLQEPLEGFLRRLRKVCLAGKTCLPALKISATIIKYSLP